MYHLHGLTAATVKTYIETWRGLKGEGVERGPLGRAQVLRYVVAVTGTDRVEYGNIARSVPAHWVVTRAQCFSHDLLAHW